MPRVGIVGWRGMVGSVLLQRMAAEQDFLLFDPVFLSTSQAGEPAPHYTERQEGVLQDAYHLEQLVEMDVILSCQGSDYTQHVYPQLREKGWAGYWIDAASHLRLQSDATLVLDPINQTQMEQARQNGCKTFVGANCTVSLMLMALNGLLREDLIDWVSFMSYQAVSGAGARAMQSLVAQMQRTQHVDMKADILSMEQTFRELVAGAEQDALPAPLLGNVLPWIDVPEGAGQSREEFKASAEASKLLGASGPAGLDGTCVRVATMRAHAQGLTIQLKRSVSMDSIEQMLKAGHQWLRWVPNTPEATLEKLTPLAVSGSLDIAVGRVRPLALGKNMLNLFTVGDQLLWGAAEPLRRTLKWLLKN